MAAWTVTIIDSWDAGGNRTEYLGTIAATGTYTTAGDTVDATANERFAWLHAQGGGTTATGLGYVFNWNAATQKLVALRQKDPAAAGGADIALPEVGNGTDLTALTAVPFRALSD